MAARIVAGGFLLVMTMGALGGCGGSKASSSPTRTSGPSIEAVPNVKVTTSSSVTIAVIPSQDLQRSGVGDASLAAVAVPAAWTVTWSFNCTDPPRGAFLLTSSAVAGPPVTVTDQTGLGGGGHKPFRGAGAYSFTVATPCAWKLSVGSTPGSA